MEEIVIGILNIMPKIFEIVEMSQDLNFMLGNIEATYLPCINL